ncbi:MAG: UDP-N-acetylmuramate dehydrogenase [Canibacter sp.]
MKYHDLPSAGPARDITEPEDVPEPPSPESIETPDPDHTFVSDDGTTLAELTTMRVGGKPDELLIAHSSNELVKYASELWDEPWLLLGGGSNTIVSDQGFPGTVVLVRYQGIEVVSERDDYVRVRVQAGHDWDELVEWSVEQGYAGIEMLSGIPGLAGAAPVQNIGAYGGELSQVLHSVVVFDGDEVRREPASDLGLEYRNSVFKEGREAVILSIDLVLRKSGTSEPIVFPQLARALDVKLGARVPLTDVRDTVLRVRASKGMVLDRNDHDTWSAGSFFTNPIVTERFSRTLPGDAPRFFLGEKEPEDEVTLLEDIERGQELRIAEPVYEENVKLSAAWLIEHAGIRRGLRLPGSGAAISTKHTLAITNLGGASAADVAELARYVVSMVQAEFGIVLVPEPNIYGLEI